MGLTAKWTRLGICLILDLCLKIGRQVRLLEVTPAIQNVAFAPSVIDLAQDNILYYVAGVCIKKVMKSHGKCDCIILLRVQNADFNSSNQVFTVCKVYSKFGDVFRALNIPSDNLVDLLTKCDSCCFIKTLQTIICVLFYAYQFFRR